MRRGSSSIVRTIGVVVVTLLALAGCSSSNSTSTPEGTSSSGGGEVSRDPVTLKLGTFGIKSQLAGSEFGVQGRLKQFNDNHEIPGVTLQYTEYADDKQDPATALSEARRLVTSEGVFAFVGQTSSTTPGEFLTQSQVPWFGWAFDDSYCSHEASTDVWGFGYNGCQVNANPSYVSDTGATVYDAVKAASGKDKPTLALFSADNTPGRTATTNQKTVYEGAGFDVVSNDVLLAVPVSDYTPYVQKLLTSDSGNPPDAILCLLQVDCINVWNQMQALGYGGSYISSLYSDLVVAPMKGSYVNNYYANTNEANPYLEQMRTAVQAVKADQPMDSGTVAGYLSTDMFIQALKVAAENGNDKITGAAVQKAASTMTWEAKDFAGPTHYPDATVAVVNACTTVMKSDGTAWQTVVPFQCSDKTFPVN